MRVLHVVESYGAGTASALDAYVRSTPDLSHHLLRRLRADGDFADAGEESRFASITDFSGEIVSSTREIRSAIRRLSPHVVHAHSSWAGALVRVVASPARRYRVVYTPHCYAFERRDVRPSLRASFWVAEAALARNTDVVAACSAREASLARTLRKRAKVVFVPNVAEIDDTPPRDASEGQDVVALGRLSAQKDPRFFGEVVRILRHGGTAVPVTWIGGGGTEDVAALAAEGVHVTGWVPRTEVLKHLGGASVYVHTALWESAPMALLEASALGVPIVARAIPALADGPEAWLACSPGEVAEKVRLVRSDAQAARGNVEAWRSHFAENRKERQRQALLEVYAGSGPRTTRASGEADR